MHPLAKLRKEAGFSSQSGFGKEIGKSQQTIQAYERGSKIPEDVVGKIIKLAEQRNVSAPTISRFRQWIARGEAGLVEDHYSKELAHQFEELKTEAAAQPPKAKKPRMSTDDRLDVIQSDIREIKVWIRAIAVKAKVAISKNAMMAELKRIEEQFQEQQQDVEPRRES